jgi:CBS domain-containing protein
MRAEDVMTRSVVSISSDSTVFDAAELLISMHFSALPVVNGKGELIGIVSEADLMRRPEIGTTPHHSWLARLFADGSQTAAEFVKFNSRRVADVMTKKVVAVDRNATLSDVTETMARHKVKRVPVVENGFLVGIVSRSNLLQALMARETPADAAAPPDDELRLKVIAAVDKQPWSSAWPTNVAVNAGVVHLWGLVANKTVLNAYRVAAENVPGVKKVKNHLREVPSSVNMGV